ncbi:MAG: hypothetical protein L6Q71_08240 [Planctomycetes bacterium]|nr:hypothetical protein [Planctomycetota bacterium]NUQ36156.1 hypothetical protein [Planctomycetaceae bacterium]
MSTNAAKLLFLILLVLGGVAGFLVMMPVPETPKPINEPDKVDPPKVTPRNTFDATPSVNEPAMTGETDRMPGTNGPAGPSQPRANDGQAAVAPVLPLWDWKAIASKAGVSGQLYAVEFDQMSGLGSSPKPGCRMTVGDGASFKVIHYKPDHDEHPGEALGTAPKGKPLPDAIVDPYALMDMVRKAYPNAEFITLRAMHRGRPVYKLDFDRTGKGEDFADLTFCAETGIDITADMAGK